VLSLLLLCLSCELQATSAAELPSWSAARSARGVAHWPGALPTASEPVALQDGNLILLSGHGWLALFDARGGLLGLAEREQGVDLLSADRHPRRDAWRIESVARKGGRGRLLHSASTAPRVELGLAGVTFTWQPSSAAPDFRVQVHWQLRARRGLAGRIAVESAPEDARLARVFFPVLPAPGRGADLDLVVPRHGWGELVPQFRGSTAGLYPSSAWNMQFLGLTNGSHGLYLAAEDPRSGTKAYSLRAGEEFHLATLTVSGAGGVAGYLQPYDFVLAPVKGDWLALADRYRRFAVAPESLAVTPVRQRRDIPVELAAGPYWWLSWDPPRRIGAAMRSKRAGPDLPTAVLWYQWYPRQSRSREQGPHWECGFPEAFEPPEDFGNAVRNLRTGGIQVFPYLNAVSADSALPGFAERYAPLALRSLEGKLLTRNWGCRGAGNRPVPFAQMDVSSPGWQDVMARRARRLVGHGVTGIYLDQLGGMPRLDLERDSLFPTGSGDAWTRGSKGMIASVQAGDSTPVIIEHPTDAYIGEAAAMLFYKSLSASMIPLHAAVYSDYRIALGAGYAGPECSSGRRVCDTDDAFAGKLTQAFLWGAQLGLKSYWLAEPKEGRKLQFAQTLARARRRLLEFFAYGRFLGTPVVEVARREARWWEAGTGRSTDVSLPAIRAARWRSTAGEETVVLVNWTGEKATGSIRQPSGWKPGEARWCEVPEPCRTAAFETGRLAIEMPPRSVRMLRRSAESHPEP
jgi:hypothetical protein